MTANANQTPRQILFGVINKKDFKLRKSEKCLVTKPQKLWLHSKHVLLKYPSGRRYKVLVKLLEVLLSTSAKAYKARLIFLSQYCRLLKLINVCVSAVQPVPCRCRVCGFCAQSNDLPRIGH